MVLGSEENITLVSMFRSKVSFSRSSLVTNFSCSAHNFHLEKSIYLELISLHVVSLIFPPEVFI